MQVGTPLTHKRFLRRHNGSYGPGIRAGEGTFPGPTTPISGAPSLSSTLKRRASVPQGQAFSGMPTDCLTDSGPWGRAGLLCCGDSTFPGIGVPAVAASGQIAANTLVSVFDHWKLLDAIGA